MIFAVIPAAGRSRRMGRCKLALPLAGSTVLERVIGALRDGGVDKLVVVVGPRSAKLAQIAGRSGATALTLEQETPGMRETVGQGLDWMEKHWQPAPGDHWFLVPGDVPAFNAGAIRRLVQACSSSPAYSIFTPTFAGRRGHPALLRWSNVEAIRKLPAGLGLDVFMRERLPQSMSVPVDDEGILHDIDTPDDYAAM